MAFRMHLGLSSVIALLMLTAAAPGPEPGPTPPIALLLHLSDLHLSRFSGDGGCSREADLKALAQGLLSVWRPDALLITGDLTHAKTPYGLGQQQQAEWQAYQRVWRLLAEASGLGPEQVLEQRGNHDTFDAPRGSPLDLFSTYSATAARTAREEGGALGRVVLDTLLPSQAGLRGRARRAVEVQRPTLGRQQAEGEQRCRQLQGAGGEGGESTWAVANSSSSSRPGGGALGGQGGTQPLLPLTSPPSGIDQQGLAAAAAVEAAPAPPPCPAALLLGFDATPELGLRPPTNFLGEVSPHLMHQLAERLAAATAPGARPPGCPPPPIIGYGHYPLSTLAYPASASRPPPQPLGPGGSSQARGGPSRGQGQQGGGGEGGAGQGEGRGGPAPCSVDAPDCIRAGGGEAAAGSGVRGGVAGVLGEGDASAYLCGHLHTVFGDRLHRLHDKPDGQAGGGGQRAYLAELMAADWKSARALRLITLDPQAGLSFTDLRFVPHRPDKVRAVDGSRRVGRHLPLITAPPDARYSALAARPSVPGSAAQLSSALRVLLLPLEPGPPAGGSWPPLPLDQGGLRVWADWRCSGAGREQLQGSLDCLPLAEQPWLWGTDLGSQGALAGCRGLVELQVSVGELGPGGGEGGGVGGGAAPGSSSEWRPLRLPPSLAPHSPGSGAGGPAAPLGVTWLAWLVLAAAWPRLGACAFTLQWGAALLLLLLPACWAAVGLNGSGPPSLPTPTPSPSLGHSQAITPSRQGEGPDAGEGASQERGSGAGGRAGAGAVQRLQAAGGSLWVLRGAAGVAGKHRGLWGALLAWLINLQLGPWLMARFHSSGGLAVMTARGVWLPGPGGWRRHPLPDAPLLTNVHLATCVLPGLFWLITLASSWERQAVQGGAGRGGGRLLPWGHVVALLLLLPLHWGLQLKLAWAYGPEAVLLAPATGWVLPLALLWLRALRLSVTKPRTE